MKQGVTVTATPASGWALDHWEGDLAGRKRTQDLVMNSDKHVHAVFTQVGQNDLVCVAVFKWDLDNRK